MKAVTSGGFRRPGRRKVCRFCAEKELRIDFKDVRMLSSFLPNAARSFPAALRAHVSSTSAS
jgi:ribosomal protein S18